MPDYGMTFSPEIVVNENGEEVVSYEHGTASTPDGRMAAIEAFNREQEGYVFTDEFGNSYHRFATEDDPSNPNSVNFDEALFEHRPEPTNEFTETDVDNIKESVGGEYSYQAMIEWARENLPDEAIDAFDKAIDSNNLEVAINAAQNLKAFYDQNAEKFAALRQLEEHNNNLRQQQPEQQDEALSQPEDEDAQTFVSSIHQMFGGEEEYSVALRWAADNWSSEYIDTYDRAIESDNPELIFEAAQMLLKSYNTEDY